MGVERREHAVDGRLDQLRLFGFLDVIRPDLLEDVAEQRELPIGLGRSRDRARAREETGLSGDRGRTRADERADQNERYFPHQPRTLPLGDLAHQGRGSTDPPSLRNST